MRIDDGMTPGPWAISNFFKARYQTGSGSDVFWVSGMVVFLLGKCELPIWCGVIELLYLLAFLAPALAQLAIGRFNHPVMNTRSSFGLR
jgi:hypothetical protein